MRTVTFSDARVAEVVNKHFVSAWFNRSPGFTNADLTTEKKIFAQSAEAYTTRNICTFIMTPEGHVFSYVARAVRPGTYRALSAEAYPMYEPEIHGRSSSYGISSNGYTWT